MIKAGLLHVHVCIWMGMRSFKTSVHSFKKTAAVWFLRNQDFSPVAWRLLRATDNILCFRRTLFKDLALFFVKPPCKSHITCLRSSYVIQCWSGKMLGYTWLICAKTDIISGDLQYRVLGVCSRDYIVVCKCQ